MNHPTRLQPCRDPGGRDAVTIANDEHELLVARDGAQCLLWRWRGEDVLWQASGAEFAPGKPVRGGVPLVFPWFGDDPERRGRPAHGFARSRVWQLAPHQPANGVALTLANHAADAALWPHAFCMQFEVALDPAPVLRWTVRNPSEVPWRFEQALHTYFAVGDVQTASVHGLQGVPCTEHAAAPEGVWDAQAPLRFRAETDRVFQDVPARLELHAPALGRRIELTTRGAGSAVVWTPWPAKAARQPQLQGDDWQRFVCIESANIGPHARELAPGASHTLELRLACANH
jgi:glucose-6-phosphate 1-epimerase